MHNLLAISLGLSVTEIILSKDANVFKLLCVVLYYLKPEIMFHKDGKFKCFGTGPSKTIAPFWLISLMGAILFYIYTRVKKDAFA